MYNKWYDQAQVSTFIVHFQNPYTYTINVVMYHHGAIDVGHESSLQLCCDLETRIPVGRYLVCISVVGICGWH